MYDFKEGLKIGLFALGFLLPIMALVLGLSYVVLVVF